MAGGGKPVELRGRVRRITFYNPENGYAVAKLEGPGGGMTLVGRMPGLAEGAEIAVRGKKVLHPKFGPQIEVESFSQRAPSDGEGVARYLASGLIKGVGPKLAGVLVEHLGPKAIDVILNEPERLRQVPGIGGKRAKLISEAVRSHGALRELMVFLQGHGVPASTSLRIWRRYGGAALSVVREEPHRLASEMHGIGFATADAIAAKIGIARDDPGRVAAGVLYALEQAREAGHCYLPFEELVAAAAQLLKVDRGLIEPAFARLHNEGRIREVADEPGRPVYLTGLFVLEERAARALARLAPAPGILPPERAAKAAQWVAGRLKVRPSPGQGAALQTMLTSGLSVLTGGPGTGKTTLVRALITIARRMGLSVALGAPTGRAAKRLGDSCGEPAQTLHRLLEYSPKENRFLRAADRPLIADLVVVDEVSMLDVWLCAHLAEAIAPGARLVLVGDADQLPSVGPGLVLRQIMESGVVQVAELTEIFRQDSAGLIVRNAHRVLHGRMPALPPPWDEPDFIFIEQPEPNAAAGAVVELVCRELPARLGLDAVNQVQVLAPMHRGPLGCENLNRLMRAELNPAAGQDLSAGDKVMQVRNNYDLEVFNGDVGQVRRAGEGGCAVDLGGRVVEYSPPETDDLTLAYAVTVHKAQGSEYPAVVIALSGEHFIMLNRPLIYTALTRGKRLVALVGRREAIARAVGNAEPVRRYARLNRLISELCKQDKNNLNV